MLREEEEQTYDKEWGGGEGREEDEESEKESSDIGPKGIRHEARYKGEEWPEE